MSEDAAGLYEKMKKLQNAVTYPPTPEQLEALFTKPEWLSYEEVQKQQHWMKAAEKKIIQRRILGGDTSFLTKFLSDYHQLNPSDTNPK